MRLVTMKWHRKRDHRSRLYDRACACCPLSPACCFLDATYHFGNASLFPADINTVYVPMAESRSFRPDLGEALTEAIDKEIEKQTPYKVVGSPNADSVLTIKLVADTKRVIDLNPYDEAARYGSELSGDGDVD